jgi:hypothetical protein
LPLLGFIFLVKKREYGDVVTIYIVVQKNTRSYLWLNKARTITHKITPRFNWFPQCEVHPLAEAIMKKFTMKYRVKKYGREKIT